ncbi:hypothetical protein SELSPUOL_00125 [Selenomonas sputigena ATCC 35185]|uniref:Uncharacterized protein n=1 Tax=Selenomonas sputigena (strain ATCC 35185 / DSM 20758 / CCUG 44933 / VPI D19B-28) TaxID=546271 RepID=C9LRQ9_SELS3|nr:hypothetical protein SELSPUOL_00125 [Selenomonas sputigena ATCC 35185]
MEIDALRKLHIAPLLSSVFCKKALYLINLNVFSDGRQVTMQNFRADFPVFAK